MQEFPESNYNNERDGGSFSVSYNIENMVPKYCLQVRKKKHCCFDAAASSIKSLAGESILSLASIGNTIDKTDNKFDPKEGWAASNNLSIAGIGGDKKYFRGTQSFAAYNQIFNENIVGALGAKVGYIAGLNQNIDISDRFYLGGNSFVGFQNAGLGMGDKTTSDS